MKKLGMISRGAIIVALGSTTPAFAQDAPPQAAAEETGGTIIVTGTRALGITAAESATPIKVLDSDMLAHVGQPNLNQVLTQLVPSFVAQAFGGDTANLTLSARLRGLSPNHALVLVNGKRRHGTANLHVLSGPFQGGAAPDLDFITPASIERVEVLEDGAAAQYGSDAIAGVINIILKKGEGGSASATAGQYYKKDGETYSGSANYGFNFGEGGYVNLTGFYRFHDYSDRGGADARVATRDGAVRDDLTPEQQAAYLAIPGFPHVNHILGDARSKVAVGSYNAGYDFGGFEVYSFGSYGTRRARAFENYRVPDRIVASPVLGVAGDFADPTSLVYAPLGFDPKEAVRETDFQFTGGVKGEVGEWRWDLSTTYGRDKAKIYTLDSANASLFVDTHDTPTDFYNGTFINSEWTSNLDIVREFGEIATLAFGAEYRENKYEIKAGDEASRYKEGGQSYPGFELSDAGSHSRHNYALYGDLALTPVDGLKLDGALRYEHYSDFGGKLTWKANGRYDFSDAIALRGTVATGFRAPTLPESYYSATNVSPSSAFVQLPANSEAAKLLGIDDLKPEKSTNFSAGLVIRPAPNATLTIDAYQIKLKNRIAGSGTLFGTNNFALVSPEVVAAIIAHGNELDPTVGDTGINIFANGIDTRTRGVDVTFSYLTDFGDMGKATWSLSANYNKTKVTKIAPTPAPILASGQALFDQAAVSILEHASPRYKVIFGSNYAIGDFSIVMRQTLYGKAWEYDTDGSEYTKNSSKTAVITDLELSYKFTPMIGFSVGANNLFNKKADTVRLNSSGSISDGGNIYDAPVTFSPYGINGGYYYARLDLTF